MEPKHRSLGREQVRRLLDDCHMDIGEGGSIDVPLGRSPIPSGLFPCQRCLGFFPISPSLPLLLLLLLLFLLLLQLLLLLPFIHHNQTDRKELNTETKHRENTGHHPLPPLHPTSRLLSTATSGFLEEPRRRLRTRRTRTRKGEQEDEEEKQRVVLRKGPEKSGSTHSQTEFL